MLNPNVGPKEPERRSKRTRTSVQKNPDDGPKESGRRYKQLGLYSSRRVDQNPYIEHLIWSSDARVMVPGRSDRLYNQSHRL